MTSGSRAARCCLSSPSPTRDTASWPRTAQRDPRHPRLHVQPARSWPVLPGRPGAGLVGRADRPRQGDRHEPLFRGRVQHARLVLRLHGAGQHQSQDRTTLWPRLPRHHAARHGGRAEGDARCARRQASGGRRRPVVRRLSGLPVGGHLPGGHGGIVAVVTAPKGGGGDEAVETLRKRLATEPHWNGGWHYDQGGIVADDDGHSCRDAAALWHQRAPGAHDPRSRRP